MAPKTIVGKKLAQTWIWNSSSQCISINRAVLLNLSNFKMDRFQFNWNPPVLKIGKVEKHCQREMKNGKMDDKFISRQKWIDGLYYYWSTVVGCKLHYYSYPTIPLLSLHMGVPTWYLLITSSFSIGHHIPGWKWSDLSHRLQIYQRNNMPTHHRNQK